VTAIVSTIEIDRAPGDVFAYLTDPARFPRWQRDVVSVRVEGSRFTTTRRIGRAERTMTQEITENSPPHRWAARGVGGPVRPNALVTVEPVGGGTRSRVTFALDFEAHGIGVPLLPLVRRQTRRGAPVSYRNLKRLLESGAA
jgi:uncharacterized protein YndB with AHSA1/START domain